MRYLIDTNVAIYFQGNRLAQPLPVGHYGYSVITEIELLSWPDLRADHEQAFRQLLAPMRRVDIDADIRERCVLLRREYRLKLPDAIIAASALVLDAVLLTNDQRLAGLSALRCQSLALR